MRTGKKRTENLRKVNGRKESRMTRNRRKGISKGQKTGG